MINETLLQPKAKPLIALPPPPKEVNWMPRVCPKGSLEEAYFRLIQAVYFHTYKEYVQNRPIIEPWEFDNLWSELYAFEDEYSDLIDYDYTPTHKIIKDDPEGYPPAIKSLANNGWVIKRPEPYAWRGQTH